MKLYLDLFFIFSLTCLHLAKPDDFEKYCSHVQLGQVGRCIEADWLSDYVKDNNIIFNYFYDDKDNSCNMEFQCSGLESCVLVGNADDAGDLIYDIQYDDKSLCKKTLQWFSNGWAEATDPKRRASKNSLYECYVEKLDKEPAVETTTDCMFSTTDFSTSTMVTTSPSVYSSRSTVEPPDHLTSPSLSTEFSTSTEKPPDHSKSTVMSTVPSTSSEIPPVRSTSTVFSTESLSTSTVFSKSTDAPTGSSSSPSLQTDSTRFYTSTLPVPTGDPTSTPVAGRSQTASPSGSNGTVIALSISLGVAVILLILCVTVLITIYVKRKQKKRERSRRVDDHLYHRY